MGLFKPMYTDLEGHLFGRGSGSQYWQLADMPAPLYHAAVDFILRRGKKSKCSDTSFKDFRKELKLPSCGVGHFNILKVAMPQTAP